MYAYRDFSPTFAGLLFCKKRISRAVSIHPSIVPARLQIISAVSIYLNENPCIAAIANCSNSVAVPKAAPAANAFFHVVFFLINLSLIHI